MADLCNIPLKTDDIADPPDIAVFPSEGAAKTKLRLIADPGIDASVQGFSHFKSQGEKVFRIRDIPVRDLDGAEEPCLDERFLCLIYEFLIIDVSFAPKNFFL